MSKGLANLGNTCSINTLIQCLGHCDTLRNALLNHSWFHKKDTHTFSLGEELTLLWKQLWVDQHHLRPIRFLKALQEHLGDSYAIGSEQMDLTEVWMVMVQSLLEESHDPTFSSMFHQESYTQELQRYLYEKACQEWKNHHRRTHSPLLDILQGFQIQQIQCMNCQKLYHNMEPFQWTYLELDPLKATTFEDSLKTLLKTDSVEGWKCDQCQSSKNEKVIRFWSLPNVWVIFLKRFQESVGFQKIHSPFECPQELQLTHGFELCANPKGIVHPPNPKGIIHPPNPKGIVYRLKSIAQHYGSLNSGHYNAIGYDGGTWKLYDDLSIETVQRPELFTQNPHVYALFYERVRV